LQSDRFFTYLHAVVPRVQLQMQTQYYEVKYCQFDIISIQTFKIIRSQYEMRVYDTKMLFPGSLSRRWCFPYPAYIFFYPQSLSDIRLYQSTCRSYFQGLSMHIMHILVQVHDTRSIFLRQIWMLIRNMWKIFNLWYLKWNRMEENFFLITVYFIIIGYKSKNEGQFS